MTVISSPTLHDAFSANGEIHQITLTGKAYSSDSVPALDSAGFTDLRLINFGKITNDSGMGLRFTTASTGSIINDFGGSIRGSDGVDLYSTGVSLLNLGTVYGFGTAKDDAAIYLGIASEDNVVENRGKVIGEVSEIRNDFGGNEIVNSGTIHGRHFGISVHGKPGEVTLVYNSGTISGGIASFAKYKAGALGLDNSGKVVGDILLQSTHYRDFDTIWNKGRIVGAVWLGAGDDHFVGTDGRSGAIFGGAGYDRIHAGRGHDMVYGGGGPDELSGGFGPDTLVGGKGSDSFLFTTGLARTGVDRIVDFVHGVDYIRVDESIFKALAVHEDGTLLARIFFAGAAAHDADDRFIYNQSNGWLIYDSNGNAAGGAHHIATLANHASLSAADITIW